MSWKLPPKISRGFLTRHRSPIIATVRCSKGRHIEMYRNRRISWLCIIITVNSDKKPEGNVLLSSFQISTWRQQTCVQVRRIDNELTEALRPLEQKHEDEEFTLKPFKFWLLSEYPNKDQAFWLKTSEFEHFLCSYSQQTMSTMLFWFI